MVPDQSPRLVILARDECAKWFLITECSIHHSFLMWIVLLGRDHVNVWLSHVAVLPYWILAAGLVETGNPQKIRDYPCALRGYLLNDFEGPLTHVDAERPAYLVDNLIVLIILRCLIRIVFPHPLVDLVLGEVKLFSDFCLLLLSPVAIPLSISLLQSFYLVYALTRFLLWPARMLNYFSFLLLLNVSLFVTGLERNRLC